MKGMLIGTLKRVLGFFWGLHKPLVARNRNLKGLHQGETCLVFANGGSLKYYDISKLPRIPGIICAYSLADSRMKSLDIRYWLWGESYSLYSFLYNTYPHVMKFQKNMIRPIFERLIKANPDVRIFANLTNIYSTLCRRKNVNYLYHFGDRSSGGFDMADNFASCHGALDYMLGVAKYLGFKKAILVGCDYLGSPPTMGHFYADYETFEGPYLESYCDRVREVVDRIGIEVLVIVPEGAESPGFQWDTYENYFGLERREFKNTEFLETETIDLMRAAHHSTQILMQHKD